MYLDYCEKEWSRCVLMKKVFWKTWSKFIAEYPCWNVISIKWQVYWNHTSAWLISCKFDAYFSGHLSIGTPLQNCCWTFLYFYCFFILFLLSYVNKQKFLLKKISIEIIMSTKFKEFSSWKSTPFNDVIILKSLLKAVEYKWWRKTHYILLGLKRDFMKK